MNHESIIADYLAGSQKLRDAVARMTPEQLDAKPIAGKWSTRQVVCHIADYEPIYADRIKRVLAEDKPTILGGDPDVFAANLKYESRDVETELQMIDAVRKHLVTILRTLKPDDWQRTGTHTTDGALSLETLLTRITNHIPHHIRFIEEKRKALAI